MVVLHGVAVNDGRAPEMRELNDERQANYFLMVR